MSELHEFKCGCAVAWDKKGVSTFTESFSCSKASVGFSLGPFHRRARRFLKAHGVYLRAGKLARLPVRITARKGTADLYPPTGRVTA